MSGKFKPSYGDRKRGFDDDHYESFDRKKNSPKFRQNRSLNSNYDTPVPTYTPPPIIAMEENKGEKAKVKWFDLKKGYGFVATSNGKDLFIHISVVRNAQKETLRVDEEILIIRGPGKKNDEVVTQILEMV